MLEIRVENTENISLKENHEFQLLVDQVNIIFFVILHYYYYYTIFLHYQLYPNKLLTPMHDASFFFF